MGSVLVSSELESIIDKDNILGRNTEDVRGLIQVTCSESDFSGTLEKIKKTNLKSVLPRRLSFPEYLAAQPNCLA